MSIRHVVYTQEPGIDGNGITTAEKEQLVLDVADAQASASTALTNVVSVKERVFDMADYTISGEADSTAGVLQALADTSADATAAGRRRVLYIKSGTTLNVSDTIVIPGNVMLLSDGTAGMRFVAAPGMNKPLLALHPYDVTPTSGTRRYQWKVGGISLVGPGKTVSGSLGFHLNNGMEGLLQDVNINGFETGLHVDAYNLANGAATYYNKIDMLRVSQCALGVHVGRQANSNLFFGGKVLGNDQGIWVEQATSNVEFFGTDIEGNGSASVPAVKLEGAGCGLTRVRLENPGANYDVHLTSTARDNVLNVYLSSPHPESRVLDEGASVGNVFIHTGYMNLGRSATASSSQVIKAERTIAANGKPFVSIEDSGSSSGTPIGYQYRYRRALTTPFQAIYNNGTTDVTTFEVRDGSLMLQNRGGTAAVQILVHNDTPNGAHSAPPGSICFVSGNATHQGLWVKESGTGNTGWVKK